MVYAIRPQRLHAFDEIAVDRAIHLLGVLAGGSNIQARCARMTVRLACYRTGRICIRLIMPAATTIVTTVDTLIPYAVS